MLVAVPVALAFSQPAVSRAQSQRVASSEPIWQFASADVQYRIDAHRRAAEAGRAGRECEALTITAGHGSYLYITHPISHYRVVSELEIALWLKASRPDLQIIARVVLPGTLDPKTGKPLFALVRGASYKRVGEWQQLKIHGFPQLVERQERILRAEHGPQIDARGAYVDFVGLNIYGGQGQTQVWIDDVEVAGGVEADTAAQVAAAESGATGGATPQPAKSVRLNGSILSVDGRPIFPRVIEHQGETLSALAAMGFNAVRLNAPPSPELLAEAEQAGIWIVSPPPRLQAWQASDCHSQVQPVPAVYDRVLIWSMGQDLTARDFAGVAEASRQIKAADRRRSRPLLAAPETDLLRYSRELRDVLSVYRFPLSTSLELTDYGNWLRERPRLARPGTPFWTVIQTQPAAAMREQWTALSGQTSAGGIDYDALRLLVYTAVGAGVRGLEFASHSPLDATDDTTRRRALALAILNAELDLVEPWAAAGSYLATADSNDPHVKAVLLQYESSRLLVVTRVGPHAQYVPQHGAGGSVSFVVPGVPESHDLVELTVGGARPLKHKRITGGTLITLADFDMTALVLITPDSVMVNALSRRLAGIAKRTAEYQRELAIRTFAQVEGIEHRLPAEVRDLANGSALTAAARRSLEESDRALAASDRSTAFIAARRAIASLGRLQRSHWERAVGSLRTSMASPLVGSIDTLPAHWQLVAALRNSAEDANRLPAGDFEDLQAMTEAGWRHLAHPLEGAETTVELSPGGTSNGRSCLRMEVRSKDSANATPLVETTPVWVTSPAVPVRRGEILCVRGRLRVPAAVRGSVDGLMIIDSLGGEALAERFGQTNGWEEFVLYRGVPRDGTMTVTFALTGFGEASIDDVTVRPMSLSAAKSGTGFEPNRAVTTDRQLTDGVATGSTAAPSSGGNPFSRPQSAPPANFEQAQRKEQIFSAPRR